MSLIKKTGVTAKFAKGTRMTPGQISYAKDVMRFPNVEILERCEYDNGTGYVVVKIHYPKSS